jgi:Domain of unknown function (DUF4157)
MRRIALAAFLPFVLLPTATQASWLSKITGVHINPSKGEFRVEAPDPSAIPDMLKNLPKDAAQFVLNPAGAYLAEAIRISRNTHWGSAQPIPPAIRSALAPYFPANVLDGARYRVKSGAISLPAAVNVLNKGNAVTLDDLIVFDSAAQTQDLELWAHELTHVVQYKNMGVESFANIYSMTGGQGLEQQARENAATIMKATQNSLPANVQASYQYAPNAFSAPTPSSAYIAASQQFVPPQFCMQWTAAPGGAQIGNACVVPVAITGFNVAGPYGPYMVPCTYNCIIAPMSWQYFGGAPGPVLGFAYQW